MLFRSNNPAIILADEPTGALDSKTGDLVMDLFMKINEHEGKTIILITHSNELAARTKRIVTIADGCITSDVVNEPIAPAVEGRLNVCN